MLAFQACSSRRERLVFGELGETSTQEKTGLKGCSRLCRDPPVKQLILQMDEDKHFIIQDLDETHLLVSADSLEMIKQHLEEEVCYIPDLPNTHVTQLRAAVHHRLLARKEHLRRRHLTGHSAIPHCCCYIADATQDQLAEIYNWTTLSFLAMTCFLPS